ncbi:DNA topoisomerase IB [Marivivens donghaensis]|uniref:DNA topoisomerase n=1 Tax=Marivivens donghaensis TaxID=1699413 RepID=A0ABX0VY41_9RHOB|nr:DNA topoisomerase IB [Marivivens donghaensis]NIY71814.1 DNA topoisomerase IB [Marivivens donghaensis]
MPDGQVLSCGLVHTSDREPGFLRRRAGKGFSYRDPDGKKPDVIALERIRGLGIPPAYENVWICMLDNGHLQATGTDVSGRKQYRYHPLWSSAQAETKFSQLIAFGEALPSIRRRVRRDLQEDAGDMAFSLAALVLLLDRGHLRIGNPAYTATNRSFGATTLLSRHLSLGDGVVKLKYRAKGGKRVQKSLRDKRLHKIMQQIGDLPGKQLFSWIDEGGQSRSLSSHDVNSYLSDITGQNVTAKTFRTWGGTLAAFETALAADEDERLTIKAMAEASAEVLSNTPTISRKSYIHPDVLDLAEMPDRHKMLSGITAPEMAELRVPERKLLTFLGR